MPPARDPAARRPRLQRRHDARCGTGPRGPRRGRHRPRTDPHRPRDPRAQQGRPTMSSCSASPPAESPLARRLADRDRRRRARSRSARSTSRCTATISACVPPAPLESHRDPGRRHRRAGGRPGRRRALLRPDHPGRARRARRPRPAARGPARRPGRPRPPRAADPRRLRRQEPPDGRAGDASPCTARELDGRRAPSSSARAPTRRGRTRRERTCCPPPTSTGTTRCSSSTPPRRCAQLADRPMKKLPTLRGRTVVNLFFEDSTRTRISFEAAAKRLSADVINFSAKGSSVVEGREPQGHRAHARGDGCRRGRGPPRRVGCAAPARDIRAGSGGSVINAGDGTHEHPTQALLDAFTMRRHLGELEGRRITIVGDVLHSRVARSNVLLLATLGAEVTLVAPPTLLPVGVERWPCETSYDLDARAAEERRGDDAARPAGAHERGVLPDAREYSRRYGLDARADGGCCPSTPSSCTRAR